MEKEGEEKKGGDARKLVPLFKPSPCSSGRTKGFLRSYPSLKSTKEGTAEGGGKEIPFRRFRIPRRDLQLFLKKRGKRRKRALLHPISVHRKKEKGGGWRGGKKVWALSATSTGYLKRKYFVGLTSQTGKSMIFEKEE